MNTKQKRNLYICIATICIIIILLIIFTVYYVQQNYKESLYTYTNQVIAKKLNISVNTAKVHVCNILQKLSVDDRTQAAIKAIKENILG